MLKCKILENTFNACAYGYITLNLQGLSNEHTFDTNRQFIISQSKFPIELLGLWIVYWIWVHSPRVPNEAMGNDDFDVIKIICTILTGTL